MTHIEEDGCIHRYQVPVDDKTHVFDLYGDPLHMAANPSGGVVDFWAPGESPGHAARTRSFIIVGTGHPVRTPGGARHWGTARSESGLVWHLLEIR